MPTVGEALDELREAHKRYLEATYHLSNSRLVGERRKLLDEEGTILADPWLEGIPRFISGERFEDLDLEPEVLLEILTTFDEEGLGAYNPPYVHQQEALESFFSDGQEIVVSTGTGSGKTEIFLYSILGHLLNEGIRDTSTDTRGCRAIILYPMNALVSDQLTRLRQFLGDSEASDMISDHFGRTVQFGKYTGQTPYHGVFDPEKNNRYVSPIIRGMINLKGTDLFDDLKKQGKIPAKDLEGFEEGQTYDRFRTQPGDRELFTRQEMLTPRDKNPVNPDNTNPHGGTPDVLVTNYSMLEYTLIRPLEQPMWKDTREWLEEDEENELLMVLDEAHLYRGAQGAEISLLLARLLRHLDIDRSRVRFILTSASIGGSDSGKEPARQFASDLTLCDPDRFDVIFGERENPGDPRSIPDEIRQAVDGISHPPEPEEIQEVSEWLGWENVPTEGSELSAYLSRSLRGTDWFDAFRASLSQGPVSVEDLGETLFPDVTSAEAREGVLNLASLVSAAEDSERDGALFPLRLHLLFRGLPKLYACVNPECPGRRDTSSGPLGAIWTSQYSECPECASRVFELWSHRDCGAPFLHAHKSKVTDPGHPEFMWTRPEPAENAGQDPLDEVALLVEEPREGEGNGGPPKYLDASTGMLSGNPGHFDGENVIKVWEAGKRESGNTYVHCPACGQSANPGGRASGYREPFGKIMDLETKGERPFANLVRKLFELQPPKVSEKEAQERSLPNRGKKVLCFSDSRQKAARLARDLQQNVEKDSFREILTLAISRANEKWGRDASLDHYYLYFLEICKENGLVLFDAEARESFMDLLEEYEEYREHFTLEEIEEDFLDSLKDQSPLRLHASILRSLIHPHYSIQGTLLGTTVPSPDAYKKVEDYGEEEEIGIDSENLETLINDLILRAQDDGAIDPSVSHEARKEIGLAFRYKAEQEIGLSETDIFPQDLLRKTDPSLSKEDLAKLTKAVKLSQLVQRGPAGGYYLNPSCIHLELTDEGTTWFRCTVCARPTPAAIGGKCPRKRCSGTVEEVDPPDKVLSARKDLFRHPANQVRKADRRPYTLRAEEHTAQLNAWSPGEMLDRAERYELLFQDILVGSDEEPVPKAIDVLSCTTTMEVGIDIGSLTGVALRTVPPRPDNYQQRAGRAGRRGRALATIATFADLSPYEQFIFENPSEIVASSSSVPVLHTENEKIVERHLFALIIQSFFHRVLPDGSSWDDLLEKDANLFESLGTLRTFFDSDGGHPYDFEAFQDWASSRLFAGSSDLTEGLANLLPAQGPWSGEPEEFVVEAGISLVESLKKLGEGDFDPEEENPVRLIEALIRANLRPAFGFPLDVCTFSVAGKLRPGDDPLTRHYEPQQDLQVALTEYAPGRSLVIDKRDFRSYGLHVPFPEDRTAPARSYNWDSLSVLAQCGDCESVISTDADRNNPPVSCPACEGHEVRTYNYIQPKGFSPVVGQNNWIRQDDADEDEVSRAVPAKLPSPDLKDRKAATEDREFSDVAQLFHARNQRLVVSNLGPENEGYSVCKDCGAILDGPVDGGHDRPFPKPPWLYDEFTPQCQCKEFDTNVAFTHEFRTDLVALSIDASTGIDFNPYAPWFRSAAISLSEALATAASRHLDLERGELRAGWRPLVRELEGGLERNIDVFLYDGTPGGAGFASRSYGVFEEIVERAKSILEGCNCDRACNKCILTYDNKFQAELIDRHAALSLLGYVQQGSVPDVEQEREGQYRRLLENVLQLRYPEGRVRKKDRNEWDLLVDDESLPIRLLPALRSVDDMGHGEPLTDYRLRRDPERIVEDLLMNVGL